ncbi:hypothetical protein BJY00DRAFT_307635 [Aspergillus carlsbadensis]|nr:hypothetical protein BJY00DRAFT_307635 [Aspergillus carlsbadensis]
MAFLLTSTLDCIFGAQASTNSPLTTSQTASSIVTKIMTAESPSDLQKQLQDDLHSTSWTEPFARSILHTIVSAISTGAQTAAAATTALVRAKDAATEFETEQPVYATLLAIGVLAILTPWVLEILGFGELGPVEGSFAARWQSLYKEYVPKRSLFGFLQKVGIKWHW